MNNTFNNCLICSSKNLIQLNAYSKDHLYRCKSCGFVFSKQIPTSEELVAEYKKYERGFTLSPITTKRYKELLEGFEIYRKNNSILDVGAGDGHFIEQAKLKGWNAYATEFDELAIPVIKDKGVTAFHGELNINDFKPEQFDVIFWSEVLEHINNPIEELKKFHYLLRKGGIVYVTTPNLNSISHKLLGEKWTIFNYPEHLSYYTPKTIKLLFRKSNFQNVKLITTGFTPDRYFASKGQEKIISTEDIRDKTENKTTWKILKSIINFSLNLFGIGDTIKAIFIKTY